MTTLEAIGFNLAAGSTLGVLCLLGFGYAVVHRHEYIAPRCAARPQNVIYDPNPPPLQPDDDPLLDRGSSPMFGWIPWTLSMTYSDLLKGIPGTGTRNGGRTGKLLSCNLDAIVLLRFHAMGLKLSMLATFLCIVVLLPMYWTSDCHDYPASEEINWQEACAVDFYNLTNYERSTLANVPSTALGDGVEDYGASASRRAQIRLYFCTITFGILQIYLIHLLKREWIEILAMRRVYYLESNVWDNRKAELQNIQQAAVDEQAEHNSGGKIQSERLLFSSRRHGGGHGSNDDNEDDEMSSNRRQYEQDEQRRRVRDPWIPDPEQRETIPEIQLYSLLVGGLPPLPTQHFLNEAHAQAASQQQARESIDWQLRLTSTFFDHCVPNQPGFSSSVAAVTILPSSTSIAQAWRKWYTAAKKLRRLRFIRAQLAYRLRQELEDHQDEDHGSKSYYHQPDIVVDDGPVVNVDDGNDHDPEENDEEFHSLHNESEDDEVGAFQPPIPGQGSQRRIPTNSSAGTSLPPAKDPHDSDNTYHEKLREHYETVLREQEHNVVIPVEASVQASTQNVTDVDRDSPRRQQTLDIEGGIPNDSQYEDSQHEDVDDDELSETEQDLHALLINRFGPEQTAVYSREFAQSAAPCCPNGCNERAVINNSNIEELKLMEQEAAAAVLNANQELWLEQQRARQLHTVQVENKDSDEEVEEKGDDEEHNTQADNETSLLQARKMPTRKVQLPSNYRMEGKILRRSSQEGSGEEVATGKDSDLSSSFIEPFASSFIHSEASTSMNTRESLSPWEKVEHYTKAMWAEADIDKYAKKGKIPRLDSKTRVVNVPSGKWKWPRFEHLYSSTKERFWEYGGYLTNQTLDYVDLTNESQYAVVTFTSRQAAVAARHCLADGRAYAEDRWKRIVEAPIPPLADSAAWDLCACRNCCRPVTLTIDEKQKRWRHYFVLVVLAVFYTLMVFPITTVATLLEPENLRDLAPNLYQWLEDRRDGITETISGFLQSSLWTLFFALCPTFFKIMANFGSLATSLANAELRALQYYWWFMTIIAFSGSLIANMVVTALNSGDFIDELRSTLAQIGRTIPSTVSASWLNWIILRTTFTMTAQYLLHLNSYLFACLGMKCCSRLDRGGGPGAPVPYRLYVDSGVVLMCVVALAPSSPLVAPAAMMYFLYSQPILRRGCIFFYRPRFDGGGFRYPFIFLMATSGLIIGQILLTIQMALKQAVGPAILASVPILFTLLSYRGLKRKYTEPFLDAALLQTSLLDGWDSKQSSSVEKREEFRKFLVDAHKAAYVPVCLAGSDAPETSLTAEPAVVVPLDSDDASEILDSGLETEPRGNTRDLKKSSSSDDAVMIDAGLTRHKSVLKRRKMQHGATLRRAAQSMSSVSRSMNKRSTKSSGSRKKIFPSVKEEAGHDL